MVFELVKINSLVNTQLFTQNNPFVYNYIHVVVHFWFRFSIDYKKSLSFCSGIVKENEQAGEREIACCVKSTATLKHDTT